MSYDAETIAALASGQLVLRYFASIYGWDLAGDPETFRYWTGEDNVTTDVISAVDGTTNSGDFIGGGTLLEVPPIVDSIGIEARTADIGFNQLHTSVEDMVRGADIRLAVVELHRGLYSPATWSLVSEPLPIFLGRVDGVRVETPAVGGEGRILITAIADVIDLTRTVPLLKSDETLKAMRDGDRFRRYGDTAAAVERWWGQAREMAADAAKGGSGAIRPGVGH